jgi:hypothetical protein
VIRALTTSVRIDPISFEPRTLSTWMGLKGRAGFKAERYFHIFGNTD